MNNKDKEFNPDFKGIWLYIEYLQCNELTLTETVVLSIIYSLDNSKGCFATNEYFENISSIKKGQITRIIGSLKEKNFITCEYDYSSKSRSPRTIKVNPNKLTVTSHSQKRQGLIGENDNSHSQKRQGVIGENDVYRDNKGYTKDHTKDERELSHFDFLKQQYPKQFNNLKQEPVSDWDSLKRKFNNKFKKNSRTPTIMDLENYILSWLPYDNKTNKDSKSTFENKPPYLRKIT